MPAIQITGYGAAYLVTCSQKVSSRSGPVMERQDTIKAGNMNRQNTIKAGKPFYSVHSADGPASAVSYACRIKLVAMLLMFLAFMTSHPFC